MHAQRLHFFPINATVRSMQMGGTEGEKREHWEQRKKWEKDKGEEPESILQKNSHKNKEQSGEYRGKFA